MVSDWNLECILEQEEYRVVTIQKLGAVKKQFNKA